MIAFFTDCVGLFSRTFYVANDIEFFGFLFGFLLIQVCIGLFCFMSRGARKM